MKKVISVVLAIIMLCSVTLNSEILAFASTSGELSNGINYSFDESIGELVLSGQGKVTQIYNGWQNYQNIDIKSVVIKNGITEIGNSAFADCSNLQKLILPNDLESIGEFAFYNCTNLKNLSLPESLTQIGECAFEYCNLSSVYVPNNNAHIGKYAFLSDNENPIILCNSTVQFDDDYNTVYYIDKSVSVKNFKDLYQGDYDFNNTLLYSFTANESGTYFSGGEGWYSDSNYMKIFDENYNLVESQKIASISEDEYNPTGGFSFNLEKGHTYYFPYGGDYKNDLEIIKDYHYFENGKQYIQGDSNYACLKIVYPDDSFEVEKYYGKNNEDLSQPITLQRCGKTITFSLNDPVTFDSFEVLNSEYIDNAFIAAIKAFDGKTLEKYPVIYRLHLSNGKTYDIKNYSMWCGAGGAVPNGTFAYYECNLSDGRQFGIEFTYYNNAPNKLEIRVNNKYIVSSPSLTIEINNQQPPQPSQPTVPEVPATTQPTAPTPTQPTQTTVPQISTKVTKPKKVTIKKVKGYKKALEVSYAKVSGVGGYQIQVATDKKFKKNKKTVTAKKSKTKVKINKLKGKKKYYVRIRAYKNVSGKKVYGAWSKVKTVKTK